MLYAKKTLLYVLTTVLGSNVLTLLLDGGWSADVAWSLGITIVGAVAVYFKQNTPQDPAAKFWAALLVPVLLAVQGAIMDSTLSMDDVVPIAIAALGAVQVWAAGNESNADAEVDGTGLESAPDGSSTIGGEAG